MHESRLTENEFARAIDQWLSRLGKREMRVLRLRHGWVEDGAPRTAKEVGAFFNLSTSRIYQIQREARAHLDAIIESDWGQDVLNEVRKGPSDSQLVQVADLLAKLTPDLMMHLQSNFALLDRVPWVVFEHLIGECFASMGFEDVRLVGRCKDTSADIYAVRGCPAIGVTTRFFVEVKHTRDRVGIEVINQVHGALVTERPRYGWHAAVLVSLGGFKRTHTLNRRELSLLGVELKDREDLIDWLGSYKLNHGGLWLPEPARSMPAVRLQG